jgi:hypothetical protein
MITLSALLLKLLESPNDTVVDSAAGALWNLAQDSDNKQRIGPEGIKQFLSLLQEPHAPVRIWQPDAAM